MRAAGSAENWGGAFHRGIARSCEFMLTYAWISLGDAPQGRLHTATCADMAVIHLRYPPGDLGAVAAAVTFDMCLASAKT